MTESTGLAVGETAPNVAAPLVRPEGGVAAAPLSALVAEKPVLLCFYPGDFSPDCIREWCAFRDYEWFASSDRVRVVGASRSSVRLHREFIDHLGLGFPLYADRDLAAAEGFGVAYRPFGLSRRARRSCFLVDESLTVRYRWVADHWLDPTREQPPLTEIRAGIDGVLGEPEVETFGFETPAISQ